MSIEQKCFLNYFFLIVLGKRILQLQYLSVFSVLSLNKIVLLSPLKKFILGLKAKDVKKLFGLNFGYRTISHYNLHVKIKPLPNIYPCHIYSGLWETLRPIS